MRRQLAHEGLHALCQSCTHKHARTSACESVQRTRPGGARATAREHASRTAPPTACQDAMYRVSRPLIRSMFGLDANELAAILSGMIDVTSGVRQVGGSLACRGGWGH